MAPSAPARDIAVISLGGTIGASPGPRGATFDSPRDLSIDELRSPHVTFRRLLHKASVEIQPSDWTTLADAVVDAIGGGASGVVVLHGTDTMAYTAAALSFLLGPPPLAAPVVFTGSMRPASEAGSDASRNVRDAIAVAASDLAEVALVFSRNRTGSAGAILRGNRARKMRSHALNAFESPMCPALGWVAADKVVLGRRGRTRVRAGAQLPAPLRLTARVALVVYHPGCDPASVRAMLDGSDGVVVVGTGAGHLPRDSDLVSVIERSGRPAALVSGCWAGRVELGTYELDHAMTTVTNIIPCGDLTPEAAIAKLIFVLSQTRDLDAVRSEMQRSMAGELTEPAA